MAGGNRKTERGLRAMLRKLHLLTHMALDSNFLSFLNMSLRGKPGRVIVRGFRDDESDFTTTEAGERLAR